MRTGSAVASAFLGLVSLAPAQRFGFTHNMLPPDRDWTLDVALGDVDGDGDLDAYVGNSTVGQTRLYLSDGTGKFTDASATNLPSLTEALAVALGDVDGDGDLDAFEGDLLQLNDGTGIFTDVTATNMPSFVPAATAVALGDADGDGDLDAFAGNYGQDRLYLNGGTGVLADVTATNLPVVLDSTTAVALGDVDGDGDLDAYTGNLNQQDRLWLNDATGVFTDATATNLPALLDRTFDVALGDVDGDGDLDAHVVDYADQDRLYLNGGTGVFTDATATSLPALLDNSFDVAFGDVDGDGDLDAFVGNVGQSRLLVNGGSGGFTDLTATNLPSLILETYAVALGDVDGDGDLDAYVGNSGTFWGGQDRLHLNGGTGVFTDVTATDLAPLNVATHAIALGDVDGDADLDVFEGDRLHLNGGTGAFTDVTATNLPPPPSFFNVGAAVALGDVDGDADLDAFTGGNPIRLDVNDGTGIFTDVTATNLPPVPTSSFWTVSVALGDVDSDGDLDAFLGRGGAPFSTTPSGLYLNDGVGIFVDMSAFLPPLPTIPSIYIAPSTRAVVLGDVDGDGDLDALLGRTAGDRLQVNGGAGFFTDVTATNLPPPPPPASPGSVNETFAVALGDVDGDGDLDAFIVRGGSSGQPEQDSLYLNGGTGVFTDAFATNLPSLPDLSVAIDLGDVDEDGDLDALAGSWLSFPFGPGSQNRLLQNDGTGVFADVTATELPAMPATTRGIALGDLDGDGDLDAFASITGQDRVYTNLTRQVARRAVTRAGKPLVLDLHGPANGFWLLAAAQATASIPLPPLGTLRLHPAALFVVGAGALDPGGRASLTILVPPVPALVGVSTYLQAAVGLPARLANLEISTVTGL